ncbi:MAG: tRNA (adenosine(37)-N6)-threonylcarbamoyltransferase complex dimerization subunit type 1 TsaB [Planctomycetaceae bacterium]|nr:tRNA (adenosine(37)-N6)-threonylcarbamoyltransferase complex dimerization subunit type 1 TsaB [Planctomycetaceae bacterium]
MNGILALRAGGVSPPKEMNGDWLILETSGRGAKVGLARAGEVVRTASLDDTRRHARDLVATIDAMLKAASLSPRELTGVVVGRGPGSYTGLRVGIVSAKALAYATGCKLVVVDTFAAIAEQAPTEAKSLWVIGDALQGHIYRQRFTRGNGGWLATDELQIERAEEWLKLAEPGTWVTGPGIKVYANRIPTGCPLVPEQDREARIESVFAVGPRSTALTREEMFALEPLYLRGSSAEEKAKTG